MGSLDTTDLAVDLRNVTKTYRGRIHALQGVQMQVRRGEIFGLLGPNGAGKSTLVKIMMTVVRPTAAQGMVLGRPVGHKPTLARVGYLPENHRFPRYLTGRQTVEFFGALARVDRVTARQRAGELLSTVGMAAWADKRISTYSKGMLQRIGLAQAMINDPDLILLDEPTDGVDPVGRRDIRDLLLRLRERGKSVFINSHLLSELEMICDRVAILVRGHVAQQGTIEELTRHQQRYDIELSTNDPAELRTRLLALLSRRGAVMTAKTPAPFNGNSPAPATGNSRPMNGGNGAPPRWPLDAGTMPDGVWVEVEGPVMRLGTADPVIVQPTLDALRGEGLVIRRLTPVRQTLEDLFMQAVIDPTSGEYFAPGAGPARLRAPMPAGSPPPLPQGVAASRGGVQ